MCIFVASAHLMKPFLLVVIYHLLIAKFIVLQFWNDVIYSAQMKFKLLDHMFPKSVFQNLKTMLIGVQSWWSDNLGCLCKVLHICTIFTTQEDFEKRWEHNIPHEESQCNMSSVIAIDHIYHIGLFPTMKLHQNCLICFIQAGQQANQNIFCWFQCIFNCGFAKFVQRGIWQFF